MYLSIIIWEVELEDKHTGDVVQREVFLFKRNAKRFIDKNIQKIEVQGLKWCMGGKQLWII